MSTGIRWSPEALADFQKRQDQFARDGKVRVRTHICRDDPDPELREDGKPRTKRAGAKHGPSELEHLFTKQLADLKLPPPRREFEFMPNRGFRLDYAWPDKKLAVEVNGMVHRIKERFLRDTEKIAMAQIHGWRVLGISGEDVRSGRGLSWLVSLWGDGP